MALCASAACLRSPRTPEDLVRDIHSYFQHSFKRQSEFLEFQRFVKVKPHKLLYASQTRWLSLLSVIKRVLEQYYALKLYFQSQYLVDMVQGSEIIFNRLSEPINKCYLLFLEFVLPNLVDLNLEFQSESPKIHILYFRITSTLKCLMDFYIKPDYLNKTNIELIESKVFSRPRQHIFGTKNSNGVFYK